MDPRRRCQYIHALFIESGFWIHSQCNKKNLIRFRLRMKKSHTKVIHSDLWKYSEYWVGYYRAAFRASVELGFEIPGEVNSFECYWRLKQVSAKARMKRFLGQKRKFDERSFLLEFFIWKEFALPTASFFNVPCWAIKAFIFCIFTKLLWSIFIASFHSTESPKPL